MIFTSYFANVKKLPKNVIPIAICLNPPVGYKGLWYPNLAPDYSILKQYKRDHDIDWYYRAFTSSVIGSLFISEVLNDINQMLPMHVQQEIQTPIEQNPDWHVALICYEKSGDFCHRHIVADWFTYNGIKCREWEVKNV